MTKEIGSEFWDKPALAGSGVQFPPHVTWYLSGRIALEVILKDLTHHQKIGRAGLPSWCCDSMIYPFLKNGIEVCFYPVSVCDGGGLQADFSCVVDCEVILVMEYFGFYCNLMPAGFSGYVIRDLTHSAFSDVSWSGDYLFGSLRKWAGFWTGGFAWKRDGGRLPTQNWNKEGRTYLRFRQEAQKEKKEYLENPEGDKRYLEIFAKAEKLLDQGAMGQGEARDIRLASELDVAALRAKRKHNAEILLQGLQEIAIFPSVSPGDCPLFVPILVPHDQRDALRRHLINKQIYCPIHWPLMPSHTLREKEEQLYGEEISLVCDQRYNVSDMIREREAVLEFLNQER